MSNAPISLMSEAELVKMRRACQLAAELLHHLEKMIQPGVTTAELDHEAERWTKAHGARSGPLGYKGFPKSICTSLNQVVCHGIPSPLQKLKDGDIINIDVTPVLDGYFGDVSKTFCVGTPSKVAQKLVQVTKACLRAGILEVAPEKRIGDIGAAIQNCAESQGFNVVKDFVGHGVGRVFHCEPQVPHYGIRGQGRRLQAGMVFTIEPMINVGDWRTKVLSDGWTAVTVDGKLSAQFEHTVAVTDNGVEVLTLRPDEEL